MTAVPPTGGAPTADDRQWSLFAWVGGIILGFIAPLVIMLTKGNESQFVRQNAVESLNFQIWMIIWATVSAILMCVFIGFVLIFAVLIVNVTFCIIGAMKTNQGEVYRCPLNFYRFVK